MISANGADLVSSNGPAYQWYLNGNVIGGATDQQWTALVSGSYTVEVTDANGCSAISAPEDVLISGIDDVRTDGFALWPTLTHGMLTIRVPALGSGDVRIRIFDAGGRAIADRTDSYAHINEFTLEQNIPAGVYNVLVEHGDQRWEARFVKVP